MPFSIGLYLAACVPAPPSPEECPREFASAEPYDGWAAGRLPGLYQITMVPTSHGTTRHGYVARLFLAPPDTLRRYYPERYGDSNALLGQQVAGVWTQQHDSTIYQAQVSIEGHSFYVGCRICPDASPLQFGIERIASGGFWGHWEDPQTGVHRVYDSAGRELPKRAGVYCAVRLSDTQLPQLMHGPSGSSNWLVE